MAKLAPTSIKYVIEARIEAQGIVEKPDVIGAIFGQTEGLLGSDLDLRELQKTGRIGRIKVDIESKKGKSKGKIEIPSSLGSAETALIGATLETIERVGPCDANIELKKVKDARKSKRNYVIDRAKDILEKQLKEVPDVSEVSEQIKEAIKVHEATKYKGLTCGPEVKDSKEILLVEGRADVLNLLHNGVKNAIGMGGTSVPKRITDLVNNRVATAFVDGDRGGELIVKEVMQKGDLDNVVSAPEGKEVEELTKKEIYKALRNKMSPKEFLEKRKEKGERKKSSGKSKKRGRKKKGSRKRGSRNKKLNKDQKERFKKTLKDLVGSRAAYVYDRDNDLLGKIPVKELPHSLKTIDNPYTIIMDGKVDQKLATSAEKNGVKYLVGKEKGKVKTSVNVYSKKDL